MAALTLSILPFLSVADAQKATAADPPSCPWMGPDAQALSPQERATMLVATMTVTEQIALLNLGHTADKENILGNQPAHCIPEFVLEDGPNGNISSGSYALPASIATAATFNPAVAYDYGIALALGARVKGQTAVQAPSLNLAVLPTWGRIGESYGEDPFLAGLLGTAEARAIVNSGSNVLVKHLSVYLHERNRLGARTTLDDRTRQEVFEAPFRQLVKATNPLGVMCAYGSVNEVANCADKDLVARYRSWGGTGFFRTDFNATKEPVAALTAGVSLFRLPQAGRMRAAITSGALSSDLLATRVTELMAELFQRGLMDHPPIVSATKTQVAAQNVATATKVANQSMVLLKNTGVLPLGPKTASIAIIGPAAALAPTYTVGGSAFVPVKQPVSFAQALTSAIGAKKTTVQPAFSSNAPTVLLDKRSTGENSGPSQSTVTSVSFTAMNRGRFLAELNATYGTSSATVRIDGQRYGSVDLQGGDGIKRSSWVITLDAGVHQVDITWKSTGTSPTFSLQDVEGALRIAAATARNVEVPVVFVAAASSEDYDHDTIGLPGFQDALIQTVARANPKTVVVIESALPIAMPWLPLVSAVVDTWLVGQIGGKPLANALTGVINPSGHLPITFPDTYANSLSGDAITQVQADGSQTLVTSDGQGVPFGMHYYRAKHRPPLFPFGFGLSYTTFTAKSLSVEASPSGWSLSALVTNTGAVAGRAVLQGYVTYPADLEEQSLQLKAVGSTILAPGASRQLHLSLDASSLELIRNGTWSVPSGNYAVSVGWSSNDLPLTTSFTIP